MALYFKVIHPVQKKGKVYLPGETIQLTEETAKHIKHCLQPIELTEKPTVEVTKPAVTITNSDEIKTPEPVVSQKAIPLKVTTPVKEVKKKNGKK